MQTKEGANKLAAKNYNLSVEDYLERIKTESYCNKCKTWRLKENFCIDRSRANGVHKNCNNCRWRNGGKRGARKGRPSTFKGRHHSDKTKKLLSDERKGNKSPMDGKKHTIEAKQKISKILRERGAKGEKCHSYKDGKSKDRRGIRFTVEYKRWRYDVFLRDKFTCQKCDDNRGSNLEAHHIKSFADFPELRFEIGNGITLCETCHKKEHKKIKMAENTKISWCHRTINLWWGCTKVHAGCDHCYAENLSHRWGFNVWGNDQPRRLIQGAWNDLARFQKLAAAAGEMHRVFVGSMKDIFEKPMPLVDSKQQPILGNDTGVLRSLLFKDIDDNKYPNLMFLFLTKRPSNINKYIPESWKKYPPSNVMFGTSPVDQDTANKLIPQLLEVKGNKFLSVEPMLGPINFYQVPIDRYKHWTDIAWVIVGGESGHEARPMEIEWVEDIQKNCKESQVPFFFKQGSENNWKDFNHYESFPDHLKVREFPV